MNQLLIFGTVRSADKILGYSAFYRVSIYGSASLAVEKITEMDHRGDYNSLLAECEKKFENHFQVEYEPASAISNTICELIRVS